MRERRSILFILHRFRAQHLSVNEYLDLLSAPEQAARHMIENANKIGYVAIEDRFEAGKVELEISNA